MAIVAPSNSTAIASPETRASTRAALATVTSLFFMWGFVTVLNDILIPHLKNIFGLNYALASRVQAAFFLAYGLFSIPAARLIDRVGYKPTLVSGVMIMGVGALLFIPAAMVPSYPLFLGALMVLAGGITVLQVAANPYVAVLGPAETAASRLNLAQAFNSLGTAIAPYFGGYLILRVASNNMSAAQLSPEALQLYRVHEASSIKLPYLVIGLVLIALGAALSLLRLPPMPSATHRERDSIGTRSLWRYRQLVFGIVGIFVYVGAEVAIGSYMINYISQSNIGNISEFAAAKYVSLYWLGAMIGRFLGSAILRKIHTGTLLAIVAISACLLVCTSMLSSGHLAMWSIILVGLFNSIMFPSIFTLGIAELGPLTGDGSGLLIMAIVGGAAVPFTVGVLADHIGLQHALILPAICYLYIVYYACKGSKPSVLA